MELSEVYSEVYAILKILGSEYIKKIPTPIYEHILAQKKDKSFKEYSIDKPISEQDISKEAIEFISYLNLQYWCNEDEKQELLKIYKQNDEKFEMERAEKYNVDDLFKKKQNNRATQLIEYNKESRIKTKIEKIIKVLCFWKK